MADVDPGDDIDGQPGTDDRLWYEQPAAYGAAALLGLLVCIGIIVVAISANGDDPQPVSSTATSTSTTETTIPVDERDCADGDADACSRLDGRTLGTLCDDEVEAACAEILTRLGEESQSTSTTAPPPTVAPASDTDLCVGGDVDACSRLPDSEISRLCGEAIDAACLAADVSFESSPFARCERGELDGCETLEDGILIDLCPDPSTAPQYAPCAERNFRGI